MKKTLNLVYILVFIVFASCESDDTGDVSNITYYPNFEMLGDAVIFIDAGTTTSYTDPGLIVTEQGNVIDYSTSIIGDYRGGSNVDISTSDRYSVSYSAINQDGFSGSISRTVWVYNNSDMVNSIEGIYTSTVVRNGSSGSQYTDMTYVLIWKNNDGTYGISDAIGGYYEYGRSYGLGYAAQGLKITANNISTNDFSFNGPISVGAFGGALTVTSMTVDAVNQSINLVTDWDSGYVFDITLTKVQP